MLIKNPITAFLYRMGYRGIENIYDYWVENEDDILSSFKMSSQKKYSNDTSLSFKYKVRWGSVLGLYLRMGLDEKLRDKNELDLKFDEIRVLYGGDYLGIADFNRMTLKEDAACGRVDLRGISIISRTFENLTIKNVNFDYAAFDGCVFSEVTFVNCSFNRASFARVKLINCNFDHDCTLKDNDFSKAFVDSRFDCPIENPQIVYMKYWRFKLVRPDDSKYIKHTIVKDPTFAEQSRDEKVKRYHLRHDL